MSCISSASPTELMIFGPSETKCMIKHHLRRPALWSIQPPLSCFWLMLAFHQSFLSVSEEATRVTRSSEKRGRVGVHSTLMAHVLELTFNQPTPLLLLHFYSTGFDAFGELSSESWPALWLHCIFLNLLLVDTLMFFIHQFVSNPCHLVTHLPFCQAVKPHFLLYFFWL